MMNKYLISYTKLVPVGILGEVKAIPKSIKLYANDKDEARIRAEQRKIKNIISIKKVRR